MPKACADVRKRQLLSNGFTPTTSIAAVGVFPLDIAIRATSAADRRAVVLVREIHVGNILPIVLYNRHGEAIYCLFI